MLLAIDHLDIIDCCLIVCSPLKSKDAFYLKSVFVAEFRRPLASGKGHFEKTIILNLIIFPH